MRLGHHNEVACLDLPDSPWCVTDPYPIRGLGTSRGRYRYTPRLVPWIRENVGRFDCAIVHGAWQYQTLGTWRALRDGRLPYFFYPHGGIESWSFAYPLKFLKKKFYWRLAEHRVLRDARAVLFTTQDESVMARQAFQPFVCNSALVNYGTAGPVGDPAAQRRAFLERFPQLDGRPFLLFLGRLHPQKGCDLLIEAFAREAGPELQLVMAGPDHQGLEAELTRQAERLGIADRVIWAGMVGGEAKWGALRLAEASCLPSHFENFGIAVVEALACGTPVLISNKVSIWREIEADGAGLVGDVSVEGVAGCLRRWRSLSAADREAMRVRARACFEGRYHVDRAAQSLLETLRTYGVEG